MNLIIIGTDNSSNMKTEGLTGSNNIIKIKGEYPAERIIRIGHINGITKVFYIINSHEPELKQYLSKNNFGLPLKFIEQNMENTIHGFFALVPFLNKESFFLVNSNSVFLENEFSEFVTYSQMQEDADGVLAITKYNNDEKPLCVAMNDEDIILKFSDSKDGYSWSTGGIYYFSQNIFNEMKYSLHAGISRIEKFLQLLVIRGYVLKGFSFSKIIKVDDVADAENFNIGNNNI